MPPSHKPNLLLAAIPKNLRVEVLVLSLTQILQWDKASCAPKARTAGRMSPWRPGGGRMQGYCPSLPSPTLTWGLCPTPTYINYLPPPHLQEGVSKFALKSWGEKASLELSAAAALSQYQMCSDTRVPGHLCSLPSTAHASVNFRHGC